MVGPFMCYSTSCHCVRHIKLSTYVLQNTADKAVAWARMHHVPPATQLQHFKKYKIL